jgi:hypothetical protein
MIKISLLLKFYKVSYETDAQRRKLFSALPLRVREASSAPPSQNILDLRKEGLVHD